MRLIDVLIIIILFTKQEFEELRNGNPVYITQLYNEFKSAVFTYLLRKFKGNKDFTEDVWSDTFESVITGVKKLQSQKNIKGWIFTIAHNCYCNYLTSIKKNEKLINNTKTNLIAELNKTDTPDDEEYKTRRMILITAWQMLDEKHQKILRLKYIEEKPQKEIALLYNKKEEAIESIIRRAKIKLRDKMKLINRNYFEDSL